MSFHSDHLLLLLHIAQVFPTWDGHRVKFLSASETARNPNAAGVYPWRGSMSALASMPMFIYFANADGRVPEEVQIDVRRAVLVTTLGATGANV